MNVLFLPLNISSMQAITCEALNRIEGVAARYINTKLNKYSTGNDAAINIPGFEFKGTTSFPLSIKYWIFRKQVKKWIEWADVVHYVWGSAFHDGADVKFAKKLSKPIFIEWVGSDLRDPEILSSINPYYKKALLEGYEYKSIETGSHKRDMQALFFEVGAIPTLLPEISLFLDRKLFPNYIQYPHRINLRLYTPEYPSEKNIKPHIVHSPSVKIGKGSNVIIKILEELKSEYDFSFTLIHDVSRNEALKLVEQSDIFIDQVIVGGYGMAACEAMAFGKPVINFILPEVFEAGLSSDCPIVNANPDNLKETLKLLLDNAVLRNEIGKKSRLFVEKHNDADSIAASMVKIYRSAINSNKKISV